MMGDYNYISDLLKTWNLSNYIDNFISQKVDAGCLRIIGDEEIRDLIPIVGDRARFKSNLMLWKAELSDASKNENKPQSAVIQVEYVGEISPENIENLSEEVEVVYSNETNSVLSLLKKSIDGKAILNAGEKNSGLLDQTLRSRLSRLIATNELTNNPSGVVPGNRLMKCAHEIGKIFPKESPTIYYIPYMSATVERIKRNASGKLYDAVVNRRRDLKKRGVIAGSSKSSRSSDSSSLASLTDTERTLSIESEDIIADKSEIEEKLHWLRNAVDPWHLVESNWTATTNVRLAALQSEGTVEEYFDLYPALKQPEGYRLLLQDFDRIYKNNKDFLYSNIILYQKNIIKVAERKIKELKDKDVKREIQQIINCINEENPESETNSALLLLPYLMPSVPSKKKGKPAWKPSRTEIREGYVTEVANVADVKSTITTRREKMLKLGRTLQPFVVYTGTVSDIQQIYVVIGETIYKLNTLLQGVDVAFKIIQATGAQYSDESYLVWLFIQRVLYNINTRFDKSLSVLHTLISDLKISE